MLRPTLGRWASQRASSSRPASRSTAAKRVPLTAAPPLAAASSSTKAVGGFSAVERRDAPRSAAPLGDRPQWLAALGHIYTQLAAGNELTQDNAQRLSRLFASGVGTRSSAIRWWWVLRGECMPYHTEEAAALVERNLWAQALHNARTVLLPQYFDADSYRRVAVKTASLALARGHWGQALQVLATGSTGLRYCRKRGGGRDSIGNGSLARDAADRRGSPLFWQGEIDHVERLTTGIAVHRAGSWEACLQAAASLSVDRPTRLRRTLELVALHRLERDDEQWWRALAYVDHTFRFPVAVPKRAVAAADESNNGTDHRQNGKTKKMQRLVTRRIAQLATRIASQRLGDPRRAAIYVDALRRTRLGISDLTERRALVALTQAGASGRSLAKLKGVVADGRKLESVATRKREHGRRDGVTGGHRDPNSKASTVSPVAQGPEAPAPPLADAQPPAPLEAVAASVQPGDEPSAEVAAAAAASHARALALASAMSVLDLDDKAMSDAASGDWVSALEAVEALRVLSSRPSAAGLPLADRAVLGSVRDLASWRDALALYAVPTTPPPSVQ